MQAIIFAITSKSLVLWKHNACELTLTFSTQMQASLKEFLREPGILKMVFDSIFCNFPQL